MDLSLLQSVGPSPDVLEQLDAGVRTMNAVKLSRFISAAAYAMFLYDWALCFDEEIRLVWPAKWSLVKLLYFQVRSGTLFGLTITSWHLAGFRPPLSHMECEAWTFVWSILEGGCLAASNFLMMLRLFALFGGKRRVVYPLTGLFVLSYTVSFIFGAVTLFQLRTSLEYHPLAHVCLGGSNNHAWAGIFCTVLLFELFILTMTAVKLYRQAKLVGDASIPPLLQVLYRDNFSYYILMFFTRIANIYIWAALPVSYFNLGINFLWAFVATLTTRLFLTLRNVATSEEWQKQTEMMTTVAPSSIGIEGNVWFARPPGAAGASQNAFGTVEPEYNGTVELSEI